MDNLKVTPNLIRRYIAGKTNLEETALVMKACKEDKYLRGYLNMAFKLYQESLAPKTKTVVINLVKDSFVKIPLALAAECERDNLCSLKCELFLLSQFHKDDGLTEDSLLSEARQLGILKDEGTPLYNMGRLLSRHGLSVIKQYSASVNDIKVAIQEQGCGVMVPIWGEKTFHAIIVDKISDDEVSYYNPATCSLETIPISSFEESWKKSNCYLVKTTLKENVRKPDSKIYHPQIEVPELTGRFKEIEWGLAEMFHDVWSSTRFKNGWKYGQMRNDEKHIHPDLIPLADVPQEDRNLDLDNAKLAVYLLTEVYGFDLVNKEDAEQYCINKLEELGYDVRKHDEQ